MFGICNLSVIPCRKEPSDKAEMVTQLLFGEHFEILDKKKSWTLIKIIYDGYECWIDSKQFLTLTEKESDAITGKNTAISLSLLQTATNSRGETVSVLMGSSLPKFSDKTFFLGKEKYTFSGEVVFPFAKQRQEFRKSVAEVSRRYLGVPYLWGGRSPFGIDCSGFTQMVFRCCGIKLKRDAWQQAKQGVALNFLEEAREGDLAFFDNEEGKIVHTGIVVTPLSDRGEVNAIHEVIHAWGKVRMDKLDHYGIYNEELKKHTHRLRVIRRIRQEHN